MSRKTLCILLAIFSLILIAELAFIGFMNTGWGGNDVPSTGESTTVPTTQNTQENTDSIPQTSLPEETEPETTIAPTETEPGETRYVLTFVGDCTLGSTPDQFTNPSSFIGTVGENYDYPFAKVVDYFENDDLTLINLEGVFADKGYAANKLFTFRAPTSYVQILTSSSVEAVTLANNHSGDFGKEGYDTTVQTLENAGVHYVEENKTKIITTESGLVIGLYADAFAFKKTDIEKNIKALKDAGAEIIICAFHWGAEGSYRANYDQSVFAKYAIDAGADIVWGHHPHVLQKIEEYNGGYIYYSLGNFSFGGNTFPRDMDSAILQQEVIRDEDGNVRLGELTIIPVSISSREVQNNFQPIPYEEGSEEYNRVLSKLDGTFKGPDLVVNYPGQTEPPTEPPTESGSQGGEDTQPPAGGNDPEPPATQPEGSGGDVTPPPAEGGESESGSGDTGSSGGEQTPPPAGGGDSGTPEE